MTRTDSAELGDVLLSAEAVRRRTGELGAAITADYRDRDLVVIGVLTGAAVFAADLIRDIDLTLELDWVSVSSYGAGSTSSGRVRLVTDVSADVTGRDVLLVDDILDTGLTLSWLTAHLSRRNPASVTSATLLRKPGAAIEPVHPSYVGFDIKPVFVAGYGIDYAGRHRNLPDVREVLLPANSE